MDRPSSDCPSARNLFRQSQRNLAVRDAWERFAPHRQRVTQLLTERAGTGSATLGVLGAGNCNDLDLQALIQRFGEIHLIDWDAAALAAGLERQNLENEAAVIPHGGVELSGIADVLSDWSPAHPPPDEEVETAIQAAEDAVAPLPAESLDVAASVCLLSQLLESVSAALPATHPRFLELIAAVRRRHLGMIVEMLRPGGRGLLITDVVSSETAPELRRRTDEDVPKALTRLLQARNFFTGLNPAVILDLLERDEQFAGRVGGLQPISPWLWDLGPRVYVVFGIGFQRTR